MSRLRFISLFALLAMVSLACSLASSSGGSATLIPATDTQTPNVGLSTLTSIPEPSQTASTTPTIMPPTATLAATTPVETATLNAGAQIIATLGLTASSLSKGSNPLGCANFNNPDVQVTIPDGIGPYQIFCSGMSGAIGVNIGALGADNKMAPKAVFAVPIKVCLKGKGSLMGMDIYNGSFTNTPLKSTREGDFTCAGVTKPGSVILNP